MWVTGTGIVVYSPHRPGIRKIQRHSPWWVIVEIDKELSRYYRWWIEKRFGLRLQVPTWGTHITVVSDRDKIEPEYLNQWKMFDRQQLSFEYNVAVEQHWKFWTLNVKSDVLTQMRKDLGLTRHHSLHITIGRME